MVVAAAARPPLRTLLLLNSLCMGGAEKQVVSLFNRLGDEGHQVFLLCLKEDRALLPQVDAARLPGVLPDLRVASGVRWPALRALARHIDELEIDVLVCTNLYAFLYGWLARRWCRRAGALRLVEVFHSTDVGSRKDRGSMWLYRWLLRRADLLVYVCHGQAAQWRSRGLRSRQDMVIYTLVFAAVWHASGLVMAIMLAGLRGIDPEIWKAARIDGLPPWRVYVAIVIPMLGASFATASVLLATSVVRLYDLSVAMTNGGPGLASEVPAKFVMDHLFERGNLGLATAAATSMLITVAAVVAPWLYWQARQREGRLPA